jgi:hypothetical protein
MPFIRGRYHINPIAGQALEAAREAEEALGALPPDDHEDSGADGYEWEPDRSAKNATGPIHRVVIETAALVPAHSGQAAHGFVARVHRAAYLPQAAGDPGRGGSGPSSQSAITVSQKPETHVFANDGDLVDFLQRELARDSTQRACAKS